MLLLLLNIDNIIWVRYFHSWNCITEIWFSKPYTLLTLPWCRWLEIHKQVAWVKFSNNFHWGNRMLGLSFGVSIIFARLKKTKYTFFWSNLTYGLALTLNLLRFQSWKLLESCSFLFEERRGSTWSNVKNCNFRWKECYFLYILWIKTLLLDLELKILY